MRVEKISKTTKFEPVTIAITFETEKELIAMHMLCNVSQLCGVVQDFAGGTDVLSSIRDCIGSVNDSEWNSFINKILP